VGDVAAATSYRDERVLRLVAADRAVPDFEHIDADDRRRFIRNLMHEEGEEFKWLYVQAESLIYGTADPDAYCPHLPNDHQYRIFEKLLLRNAKRINNLNIQVVMELNSGCPTDPDKIKLDELLNIRRDEEVFSSWRELVRNSVNMAEARKQDDVSRLDIFKNEVSNRSREWRTNFQKYNNRNQQELWRSEQVPTLVSISCIVLRNIRGVRVSILRRSPFVQRISFRVSRRAECPLRPQGYERNQKIASHVRVSA
jgi:hypothetical protein